MISVVTKRNASRELPDEGSFDSRTKIKSIGLHLAKNVFLVHGVDSGGRTLFPHGAFPDACGAVPIREVTLILLKGSPNV